MSQHDYNANCGPVQNRRDDSQHVFTAATGTDRYAYLMAIGGTVDRMPVVGYLTHDGKTEAAVLVVETGEITPVSAQTTSRRGLIGCYTGRETLLESQGLAVLAMLRDNQVAEVAA